MFQIVIYSPEDLLIKMRLQILRMEHEVASDFLFLWEASYINKQYFIGDLGQKSELTRSKQ